MRQVSIGFANPSCRLIVHQKKPVLFGLRPLAASQVQASPLCWSRLPGFQTGAMRQLQWKTIFYSRSFSFHPWLS